ncbi:ribbon-helix-helix protein, CopG family, partial [Pseudomonas savastanoi]
FRSAATFQVGFEPELLAEFDAARKQLGLSRPALIKIAVRRLLDAGV